MGDESRVGPVHAAHKQATRRVERLTVDYRLEQFEPHGLQQPFPVGLGAGAPALGIHQPMVQLGETRSEFAAAVGPERFEPLEIELEGAPSTLKVVAALERTEQLALEDEQLLRLGEADEGADDLPELKKRGVARVHGGSFRAG
jgi:hypothetical protein